MRWPLVFSAVWTALLAVPARAVVGGEATRDPNGVRRSVVRIESSRGELCSGALIAADLVLTAAHCIAERDSYRVVALDRGFKEHSFGAIGTAIHPKFVAGTTPDAQPGVDLALVRLERALEGDFSPLDPRLAGGVAEGDQVILAGFGVFKEGHKRTARTLRQTVLVSLGAIEGMNRVLAVADRKGLARMPGAGACRGDSGGPILAKTISGYRLLGIVSWSSGPSSTRTRNPCGGFTAVTPAIEHAGWIVENARRLGGTLR